MDIIFTPKTTEAALGTDDAGSSNVGTSPSARATAANTLKIANKMITILIIFSLNYC